jgi:hypothetical protein
VWFSHRKKIAPRELSETLFEILVQGRERDETSDQFSIPPALVANFRAKVTLYREAVILMNLLSVSETKREYGPVLREYEELVFGATQTAAGLEKLKAVKGAMADLHKLISPQGRPEELTWSSTWLEDIGHIDHNPARTTLFAVLWMSDYAMVARLIRQFKPVKARI